MCWVWKKQAIWRQCYGLQETVARGIWPERLCLHRSVVPWIHTRSHFKDNLFSSTSVTNNIHTLEFSSLESIAWIEIRNILWSSNTTALGQVNTAGSNQVSFILETNDPWTISPAGNGTEQSTLLSYLYQFSSSYIKAGGGDNLCSLVHQQIHRIEEHFHHLHSAATSHGPPLNEGRGRSVCL